MKNKTKLRGDIPCNDCGTEDNPIWFTDNVFWNSVMKKKVGLILCINCFIIRAEKKYKVLSWRILPGFKWERHERKI